jgi:hypothetical protein
LASFGFKNFLKKFQTRCNKTNPPKVIRAKREKATLFSKIFRADAIKPLA